MLRNIFTILVGSLLSTSMLVMYFMLGCAAFALALLWFLSLVGA